MTPMRALSPIVAGPSSLVVTEPSPVSCWNTYSKLSSIVQRLHQGIWPEACTVQTPFASTDVEPCVAALTACSLQPVTAPRAGASRPRVSPTRRAEGRKTEGRFILDELLSPEGGDGSS